MSTRPVTRALKAAQDAERIRFKAEEDAFQKRWERLEVSGQGLLCGLLAVKASFRAQFPDRSAPLLNDLYSMRHAAVAHLGEEAHAEFGDDNFSDDHLLAILNCWCQDGDFNLYTRIEGVGAVHWQMPAGGNYIGDLWIYHNTGEFFGDKYSHYSGLAPKRKGEIVDSDDEEYDDQLALDDAAELDALLSRIESDARRAGIERQRRVVEEERERERRENVALLAWAVGQISDRHLGEFLSLLPASLVERVRNLVDAGEAPRPTDHDHDHDDHADGGNNNRADDAHDRSTETAQGSTSAGAARHTQSFSAPLGDSRVDGDGDVYMGDGGEVTPDADGEVDAPKTGDGSSALEESPDNESHLSWGDRCYIEDEDDEDDDEDEEEEEEGDGGCGSEHPDVAT
jgi:hypothetical protein